MYRVGGDVLRWSTRYSECENVRGQLCRVLSFYGRHDLYRGWHLLVRKGQAAIVTMNGVISPSRSLTPAKGF
jgi:hypothetical protein